jgi:hypothetical protein
MNSLLAGLILSFAGGTAEAYERGAVSKAPVVCEAPGPKWIATVRLDMSGVIVNSDAHLQVLSTSAMGLAGVPSAATAGGGTSVMMTLTPDEAREMGQRLIDWADSPTDSVVFTRVRKYPTPPGVN